MEKVSLGWLEMAFIPLQKVVLALGFTFHSHLASLSYKDAWVCEACEICIQVHPCCALSKS